MRHRGLIRSAQQELAGASESRVMRWGCGPGHSPLDSAAADGHRNLSQPRDWAADIAIARSRAVDSARRVTWSKWTHRRLGKVSALASRDDVLTANEIRAQPSRIIIASTRRSGDVRTIGTSG